MFAWISRYRFLFGYDWKPSFTAACLGFMALIIGGIILGVLCFAFRLEHTEDAWLILAVCNLLTMYISFFVLSSRNAKARNKGKET